MCCMVLVIKCSPSAYGFEGLPRVKTESCSIFVFIEMWRHSNIPDGQACYRADRESTMSTGTCGGPLRLHSQGAHMLWLCPLHGQQWPRCSKFISCSYLTCFYRNVYTNFLSTVYNSVCCSWLNVVFVPGLIFCLLSFLCISNKQFKYPPPPYHL